jgi:hypothetical protein
MGLAPARVTGVSPGSLATSAGSPTVKCRSEQNLTQHQYVLKMDKATRSRVLLKTPGRDKFLL